MSGRCVILYAPTPNRVVDVLRARGIAARQCFDLDEVNEQFSVNAVCAVVFAPGTDPETNVLVAKALAANQAGVCLVSVGDPVPGVGLHLSWPLPERSVLLEWLHIEGAPLRLDDEDTHRTPAPLSTLAASRPAHRPVHPSAVFMSRVVVEDDAEEPTLPHDELSTMIDAMETEILFSLERRPAPTRLRGTQAASRGP